jgi:hypothetical protein
MFCHLAQLVVHTIAKLDAMLPIVTAYLCSHLKVISH